MEIRGSSFFSVTIIGILRVINIEFIKKPTKQIFC